MSASSSPLIFRKGLDRKQEVALQLAEDYHSDLVAAIKRDGFVYSAGRITVHLAREFGFCYGVDRAVDYAYQARVRFPDRRIFLTGEIIHNPHVNDQLRSQGIRFLTDPGESADAVTRDDVVILPAFGIALDVLETFVARGCTLVDTTCGSVLNVWKNVTRYTAEGITSVIHGKYWHEETQATASQAGQGGRGHYLVVLDRTEAAQACDYIRNGGDRGAFLAAFGKATSPGFDPDLHLQRVGCANQTTMLSSESLEVGQMFRAAIADRYRRGRTAPPLPRIRHHLQRHPGSPGCRDGAARRTAAGSDAGAGRPQQQQHLQPGPHLRQRGAHLPRRRAERPGVGGRNPAPAGGRPRRRPGPRLAAAGTVVDRPDRRGIDA